MLSRFRFVALAIVGAVVPSLLSAQMSAGAVRGARFGILIGPNFSSISDAGKALSDATGAALDQKRRVGLDGGVFLQLPLSGIVSLQPEVHYAQKGVEISSSDATAAGKLALNLAYVEIPVLLRFDLRSGTSSIHPVLMAGASGAFRVQCALKISGTGAVDASQDCDATAGGSDPADADAFKKYDVSAVGGAGLALNAMGRSYLLQVRYTQGVSSIAKDNSVNEKIRNNTFSILLGIGF